MRYCRRCLNVDTRPNTRFNETGLCPPCEFHQNQDQIDWDHRRQELKSILRFGKENNTSGYDCIVGVSGGKDSTRQALYIRDNFGLKPLLVSMNYSPEQISKRGVDNLSNLIDLGFDCINIGCGPKTWKEAMKIAFFKFGNWAKATEYALFASVPRLAVAYQIPLVWWGESQAILLGDLGVMGTKPYDANRIKYSNTIGGGSLNWLTESGLSHKQLLQYIYPSDKDMVKANLNIIYMDYFMPHFDQFSNSNYAALRGISIKKANPLDDPDLFGTSMLDEDFFNINMYIRYLKFGFGRTNDIVNQEIRSGRMTRKEAIRLVTLYDGNYDESILEKFCNFLDIPESIFWETVDTYINQDLFERIALGKYRPKFIVGVGI